MSVVAFDALNFPIVYLYCSREIPTDIIGRTASGYIHRKKKVKVELLY